MARKKVQLAYIANGTARRATFIKRREGLLKKVSELSTLCGVNACAIVYGPYDLQPQVWPAQPDAYRVLMRFRSLPEIDQLRNVRQQLNQESFLRNRIEKIKKQWKKHHRENRYMELEWIYNHALNGECSIPDHVPLVDFAWMLDEKQEEAQHKLAQLKKAPTPVVQTTTAANTGSGGAIIDGKDQEIIRMAAAALESLRTNHVTWIQITYLLMTKWWIMWK
ncbi:hypothetical protein MKX01_019774 [Papaver californicum]|nr:hypothetical protein MKX01_019774 [Papaver californicum]